MSDLKQREYYKIFSGTNQTGGYDKVHLGYEASTTEIVFKKDNTTYFHVPFFSTIQELNSQIIGDGAIPGPIPAMADRIQERLGGYGKNTPWGNPTKKRTTTSSLSQAVGFTDGTWLCSWLYAENTDTTPVWYDRFYNPGRITYEEALRGDAEFDGYAKNDPAFFDVQTLIQLEPGVWYQYFHQGEKTGAEIVSTFAGVSGENLVLDINTWLPQPVDTSVYKNKVISQGFKTDWITFDQTPGAVNKNVFDFNNTDFINTFVTYNSSYSLQNEFTVSFWVQNNDWSTTPSTQLVGNLNDGGYGIFYNNLKYYPYFVIPENYYGHVFFFNQEGKNFLDKSTQVAQTTGVNTGTSNPIQVAINGEQEVLVLEAGLQMYLYKLNYLGDAVAVSRDSDGNFFRFNYEDIPKTLTVDQNNGCFVVSTSGVYYFDQNLTLVSFSDSIPYQEDEKNTFNIFGTFVREPSCLDVKFDNYNNKWTVKTNGDLYCNNTLLSSLPGGATNVAVDPNNTVWVLYGTNKVYKIHAITKQVLAEFEIGGDVASEKNISFIYSYDRKENTQTWYAVIYRSTEQTLYQATLDGDIKLITFLPSKLNITITPPDIQDKSLLQFTGKGDFTGYEWKRIFNKILYNNNPQIQFKQTLRKTSKNSPLTTYAVSVPVHYFTNKTWHLITCILQNRVMKVYIDDRLRDKKEIPTNYTISNQKKNNLYIGTPCGRSTNLNFEINSTGLIYNGKIDKLRIYNYALDEKFIPMFNRETLIADNVTWGVPTAQLQYIEIIDRFFKHKLPGSKSQFFKIKLTGLQITDSSTKIAIETAIKTAVNQIKPAYSELLAIEWIE